MVSVGRGPYRVRVALRLKALRRLVGEVVGFANVTGSWWIVPVVLLLVGVMLAAGATQSAVPVAVYTFF